MVLPCFIMRICGFLWIYLLQQTNLLSILKVAMSLMTSSLSKLTISVHWSVFLVLLQDGWTPFHAACQEGQYQVAELLLQAGTSVEQKTKVRQGVGRDCVCDTEQCCVWTCRISGELLFNCLLYLWYFFAFRMCGFKWLPLGWVVQ